MLLLDLRPKLEFLSLGGMPLRLIEAMHVGMQ